MKKRNEQENKTLSPERRRQATRDSETGGSTEDFALHLAAMFRAELGEEDGKLDPLLNWQLPASEADYRQAAAKPEDSDELLRAVADFLSDETGEAPPAEKPRRSLRKPQPEPPAESRTPTEPEAPPAAPQRPLDEAPVQEAPARESAQREAPPPKTSPRISEPSLALSEHLRKFVEEDPTEAILAQAEAQAPQQPAKGRRGEPRLSRAQRRAAEKQEKAAREAEKKEKAAREAEKKEKAAREAAAAKPSEKARGKAKKAAEAPEPTPVREPEAAPQETAPAPERMVFFEPKQNKKSFFDTLGEPDPPQSPELPPEPASLPEEAPAGAQTRPEAEARSKQERRSRRPERGPAARPTEARRRERGVPARPAATDTRRQTRSDARNTARLRRKTEETLQDPTRIVLPGFDSTPFRPPQEDPPLEEIFTPLGLKTAPPTPDDTAVLSTRSKERFILPTEAPKKDPEPEAPALRLSLSGDPAEAKPAPEIAPEIAPALTPVISDRYADDAAALAAVEREIPGLAELLGSVSAPEAPAPSPAKDPLQIRFEAEAEAAIGRPLDEASGIRHQASEDAPARRDGSQPSAAPHSDEASGIRHQASEDAPALRDGSQPSAAPHSDEASGIRDQGSGDGETDCHDQSADWSRNDKFGTEPAVGAVIGRPQDAEPIPEPESAVGAVISRPLDAEPEPAAGSGVFDAFPDWYDQLLADFQIPQPGTPADSAAPGLEADAPVPEPEAGPRPAAFEADSAPAPEPEAPPPDGKDGSAPEQAPAPRPARRQKRKRRWFSFLFGDEEEAGSKDGGAGDADEASEIRHQAPGAAWYLGVEDTIDAPSDVEATDIRYQASEDAPALRDGSQPSAMPRTDEATGNRHQASGTAWEVDADNMLAARSEDEAASNGETDCHDQSADWSRNDKFEAESAVGAAIGRPLDEASGIRHQASENAPALRDGSQPSAASHSDEASGIRHQASVDGETDCHDQSADWSRNDIFEAESAVGAVIGRPLDAETSPDDPSLDAESEPGTGGGAPELWDPLSLFEDAAADFPPSEPLPRDTTGSLPSLEELFGAAPAAPKAALSADAPAESLPVADAPTGPAPDAEPTPAEPAPAEITPAAPTRRRKKRRSWFRELLEDVKAAAAARAGEVEGPDQGAGDGETDSSTPLRSAQNDTIEPDPDAGAVIGRPGDDEPDVGAVIGRPEDDVPDAGAVIGRPGDGEPDVGAVIGRPGDGEPDVGAVIGRPETDETDSSTPLRSAQNDTIEPEPAVGAVIGRPPEAETAAVTEPEAEDARPEQSFEALLASIDALLEPLPETAFGSVPTPDSPASEPAPAPASAEDSSLAAEAPASFPVPPADDLEPERYPSAQAAAEPEPPAEAPGDDWDPLALFGDQADDAELPSWEEYLRSRLAPAPEPEAPTEAYPEPEASAEAYPEPEQAQSPAPAPAPDPGAITRRIDDDTPYTPIPEPELSLESIFGKAPAESPEPQTVPMDLKEPEQPAPPPRQSRRRRNAAGALTLEDFLAAAVPMEETARPPAPTPPAQRRMQARKRRPAGRNDTISTARENPDGLVLTRNRSAARPPEAADQPPEQTPQAPAPSADARPKAPAAHPHRESRREIDVLPPEEQSVLHPEEAYRVYARPLDEIGSRLVLTGLFTILSLFFTLYMAQGWTFLPEIFSGGTTVYILLGLLGLMILVNRKLYFRDWHGRNGLKPELLLGLATLFTALDCFPAALALRPPFTVVVGALLMIALWGRYDRNLALMTTVKVLRAEKLSAGVSEVSDITKGTRGLTRTEPDVDRFMAKLETRDLTERVLRWYTLAALVGGGALTLLLTLLLKRSFLWTGALIFLGLVPVTGLLAYPRLFCLLSGRLAGAQAALCGYHGAEAFGGEHAILIGDDDIFPSGSLALNGFKVYSGNPDQVIAYAAAACRMSGSALDPVFEDLLVTHNGRHYTVDNFRFYDSGGIGASIQQDVVLMGSLDFMRRMGVHMDRGARVKQAVYMSLNGELAAVFAVRYTPPENLRKGLAAIAGNRHFKGILVTRTFLGTPGFLKVKFGIPTGAFQYPSTKERIRLSEAELKRTGAQGAILAKDSFSGFAQAAAGGRMLRSATLGAALLTLLAGAVGLVLMGVLAALAALETATALNLLLYTAVWLAPTLLLTAWGRHF